jgi:hypothetical protein
MTTHDNTQEEVDRERESVSQSLHRQLNICQQARHVHLTPTTLYTYQSDCCQDITHDTGHMTQATVQMEERGKRRREGGEREGGAYDVDGAVRDDGGVLQRVVVHDAYYALGVDGGVDLRHLLVVHEAHARPRLRHCHVLDGQRRRDAPVVQRELYHVGA